MSRPSSTSPSSTSSHEGSAQRAPPRRSPGESRFPFGGYPSGWFVVALSTDVIAGSPPISMHYFGRELIAYRGASGTAFVTSAYCPHLGAHLGHGGCVEGDLIRCPFHGWRFEGDGRCAGIPYTEHTPPRARLETFPVREQNGVIHVFFDESGAEPWALPVLDEDGWTPGRVVHWRALRTHPQEVFENTVDITHIGPVHDGRGARLLYPPARDAERMVVELEFEAPGDIVAMPGTLNDVHLHVSLHGLGVVFVQTHVRNVGVRARQRIYATPVDEESIDIRGIVHVQKSDDAAFTESLATLFYDAYVEDFARDFPIWENKRYLSRPAIAKGDGPIGVYRHWCEQFYGGKPGAAHATAAPSVEGRPDVPAWVLSAKNKLARGTDLARGWLGAVSERARHAVAPRSGDVRAAGDSTPTDDAATARPRAAAPAVVNGASAVSPPEAAAPTAPTTAPTSPARPSLRIASAREYFDTLERRFVPTAAKGVDAVFQWELADPGGETFHAVVQGNQIDVRPGPHPRPTVALVMPADDYVRVVNGELDGTWAFTSGRGKVRGSLSAAMKMRSLFPA